MSVGRSIRVFLADGTPGGLLTAEIMNWTGHIVAAPRSDLAALLRRPETSRTGVYLLLGDDPETFGGTVAYIGEGDDVGTRLRQHAREQGGKDFWERAIVLTSKDANLTKAHARYLESSFIALAQQARRSRLVNGTAPPLLPLPEADVSDMEYFIAQVKIILPVLGVNILRAPATAGVTAPSAEPEPGFAGLTYLRAAPEERRDHCDRPRDRRGVHRVGRIGGAEHLGRVQHVYKALHERLLQAAVLVPSTAAAIGGLTCDGTGGVPRVTWRSRLDDHVFVRTTKSKAAAAARIGAGLGGRKRVELLGLLRSCFVRTETWLQAGKYVSCAGQRAAEAERVDDRRACRGPVAGPDAAAAEPGVVGRRSRR